MDNVIFEDPSKQRSRAKRPSHVQAIQVTPDQNAPTDGQQQIGVPNQSFDVFDLELDDSGMPCGKSDIYILLSQTGLYRK